MSKPKEIRKVKVSLKDRKAAVAKKKAELDSVLNDAPETTDKINKPDRRYEKHDRVADDEQMRRISHKALKKAEKVLESINVKDLPHTHKATAFDMLIKNARLLMGLSTQNVAKADLRIVALKVLEDEQKGKKAAKNGEPSNEPIDAEYSGLTILSGPETIHSKE